MLYDITRTIAPGTAVWPGDTTYSLSHNLRLSEGASVNLTTIKLSPHTATHADAYYHYEPDGTAAVDMPLSAYLGPARVVTVPKIEGPLLPEDFAHLDLTRRKRLLIHSAVSDLPDDQWPERFPYLSTDLIDWLAERGFILIGLDSPSVDAFDSQSLLCHHALYRCRMVNIELLNLRGVPDGDYELIALPLKLAGACASPVRAILRTLPAETNEGGY